MAGMRAGAKDYITKGNLRRLVPAALRELREARVRQMHMQAAADVKMRLIDVIECLNEAFALFDIDDRLVLYNSRYLSIRDQSRDCEAGGVVRDHWSWAQHDAWISSSNAADPC